MRPAKDNLAKEKVEIACYATSRGGVLQATQEPNSFELVFTSLELPPEERENLKFRRVRAAALRADNLTPSGTRWSIPPLCIMWEDSLATTLARCFLAGEPTVEAIIQRSSDMLGRRWRWLIHVAKRYLVASAGKTRLRHAELTAFLLRDEAFSRAWAEHSKTLRQCSG